MDFKAAIKYSLYAALLFSACLYIDKGLVSPINDPWFVPIIVSVSWGAYNAN